MVLNIDNPTSPDGHDGRASGPPTMTQDQAVIGWLATRPTMPTLTRDLLIDVLIVWEVLAPFPAFTALPSGGTDVDIGRLLRQINHRLLAHPCHPDDFQAQMAIADLRHLLGLARYSLLDPDGAPRRPRASGARPHLGRAVARLGDGHRCRSCARRPAPRTRRVTPPYQVLAHARTSTSRPTS